MPLRSLPIALCAFSLPLAAQQTWTVDDDAPADFASLQAAIDAAADGDTILVRAGLYGPMTIEGKGLTIQGEGDVVLEIETGWWPTLGIRLTGASQPVHLRGLDLSAFGSIETPTALLQHCAGAILLEECLVSGTGTPLVAEHCASVTLSRCELIAPPTSADYDPFVFGGFKPLPGLIAEDSSLFLYNSVVSGSSGKDAGSYFFEYGTPEPGPSAPGVIAESSSLLASGSTLRGGDGGNGTDATCWFGEDGSPALVLEGATSVARLLDCETSGGAGGAGKCGQPDGVDAPAIAAGAGEVITLPGGARTFASASPVVEGALAALHFAGAPGDLVLLHLKPEAAPALYLQELAVALHLPLPAASISLGAIPPSGALDLTFPAPPLPPGVESLPVVGQALFVGAQGLFEGGPSTLLIVDPSL